jgi:hypothetical protein
VAVSAAAGGGAIKVSPPVHDQACIGMRPVRVSREAVKYGVLAGRRVHLEHCSVAVSAAAGAGAIKVSRLRVENQICPRDPPRPAH